MRAAVHRPAAVVDHKRGQLCGWIRISIEDDQACPQRRRVIGGATCWQLNGVDPIRPGSSIWTARQHAKDVVAKAVRPLGAALGISPACRRSVPINRRERATRDAQWNTVKRGTSAGRVCTVERDHLRVQESGEDFRPVRYTRQVDVASGEAIDVLVRQAYAGNFVAAGDEVVLEELQ